MLTSSLLYRLISFLTALTLSLAPLGAIAPQPPAYEAPLVMPAVPDKAAQPLAVNAEPGSADQSGQNSPQAAYHTVEILSTGIQPDILQITAGETVTFTNLDSLPRSINLVSALVNPQMLFLPAVRRSSQTLSPGPAAGTASSPAAPARSSELITIQPGQSVQRIFAVPGNFAAQDAANASLQALLYVIPQPAPADGAVSGQVLDYKTKLPLAGASVKALELGTQTTTNADGRYTLTLPPGVHTLVMFASGHTFANRKITVQHYTPYTLDTVELVPLDPVVEAVTPAGATVVNSTARTSVVFATGAVTTTKAVRLTELPVDEFTGDWAALPGPFTDGSIPMGFVMFEPDGTQFSGSAVWTIAYTGTLPVGTWVPCYYWLEAEARWGEPVDGFVVDLGGGQKGLRATLPHFSSYGFAPPPPQPPQPPVTPPDKNPQDSNDPRDNPNCPKQNNAGCGSLFNTMSGDLVQVIGTQALPNLSGLPTQVTAAYSSMSMAPTQTISLKLGVAPGTVVPDEVTWDLQVAGQVFTGTTYDVLVNWNGLDLNGRYLTPGLLYATLTARFRFKVNSAGRLGGPNGPPATCSPAPCGWVVKETTQSIPVKAARPDLSTFGLGWWSAYDSMIIDRGTYVTELTPGGREVRYRETYPFSRQYDSPLGIFTNLIRFPDYNLFEGNGQWLIRDPYGSIRVYDKGGRLVYLSDRFGNDQRIYYYFGMNFGQAYPMPTKIAHIVDRAGNRFTFRYDQQGWLTSITDKYSRVTLFEHDTAGHLLAVTDAMGSRQTYSYDARGFMTSRTDRRGFTTTYLYDSLGRLTSRTHPTGSTLTASYNPGRVDITADNGAHFATLLDAENNPVQTASAVYTTTNTFDSLNMPQSSTNPAFFAQYDSRGNPLEVLGVNSLSLQYEPNYNNITHAARSDGSDSVFGYDPQGKLTSYTNALGQTYQFTYQQFTNLLTSMTDPLGQVTSYAYTPRGQISAITDPLGRKVQFSYDQYGNLLTFSDPLNHITQYEHDALNRVTAVVNALNGRSSMTWDANSNLTSFSDATGRTTTYAYDSLNRPVSVTSPGSGTQQYAYDPSGNLSQITDPRGQVITYSYDSANRLAGKNVAGGPAVSYTYDNLDRLTSITEPALAQTFRYLPNAPLNMLLQSSRSAPGLPITTTVNYNYSGGLVDARFAGQGAQMDIRLPDLPVTPTLADRPAGAAPELRAFAQQADTLLMPAASQPARPALTCDKTLTGAITTTQILSALDADPVYCFSGSAAIQAGVIITVPAGVTLASADSSNLTVFGKLALTGAQNNPAVLTSGANYPPDNVNTGTQYNVYVKDNGRLEFHYAEMRYAGHAYLNCGANNINLTENASLLADHSVLGAGGIWTTIFAQHASSVTLSNSQVIARNCYPVDLENTGGVSLSNNIFFLPTANGEAGRATAANTSAVLNGGNVFSSTLGGPVSFYFSIINNGSITTDTVWNGRGDGNQGLDVLNLLFTGLQVINGSTLTIHGPWAIRGNGTIAAGVWNTAEGGTLRLLGTPGKFIYLYYDGGYCTYSGLYAYQNGVIETAYTDLDGNDWCSGNGVISAGQGGQIVVDHTDVRRGARHGVLVAAGARAAITNSRIFGNTSSALYGDANAGPITIASTEIFGNGSSVYTVILPGSSGGGIGPGVSLHDNSYNVVMLHGSVTVDVTLSDPPNGYYLVSGSLSVNSGGRLRIPAGTRLYFQNALYVNPGGRVDANGTPAGPVQLSAWGATWNGLAINSGVVTLNHTLLERSDRDGIGIYPDGQITVTQSLIANNAQYGVNAFYANLGVKISRSSIVGNGLGGANNSSPQIAPIQAVGNYWGASSGPANPQTNPQGTGQKVSAGVNFAPFSPAFTLPGDGRLSGIQLGGPQSRAQTNGLTYDAAGQLTSLTSSGYTTYTLGYSYDALGRTRLRAPLAAGSPAYGFRYDAAGRLNRIAITSTQTSAGLMALAYSYDLAGNLTGLTSSRDGAAVYTYDALNRLTAVSSPGFNTTYQYDAAGNRTKFGSLTFSYDAGGRLASSSDGVSYAYDAAGNLLTRTQSGQTTSYTWDGQNRLVRIDYQNGTYSAYTYDEGGRRTSKRKPDGSIVYYIYVGVFLAQERDASGAVIASYTYDSLDRPISMWRGGQTYYYLLDHLGSVLGLVDAGGVITATYRYDPWGRQLSATGTLENNLRFAGREFDTESGLYFMRARYYDPRIGRFISPDPSGLHGGFNRYAYAYNAPTYVRDPLGLDSAMDEEYYRQLVGEDEYEKTIDMTPEEREIYFDDVGTEQLLGPEEYAKYQEMGEEKYKEYIEEEAYKQMVGDDIYEQTKDMSKEERRDFFDKMADDQMKDDPQPEPPPDQSPVTPEPDHFVPVPRPEGPPLFC